MFYSFDLDPMILVLKLDLDMVKMYLHTKIEVPSYSSSKVVAWTDRQTDPSEIITSTHMRMVITSAHHRAILLKFGMMKFLKSFQ